MTDPRPTGLARLIERWRRERYHDTPIGQHAAAAKRVCADQLEAALALLGSGVGTPETTMTVAATVAATNTTGNLSSLGVGLDAREPEREEPLDYSDGFYRKYLPKATPAALSAPRTPEHTTKETHMTEQIPTIGRVVHYRLSADEAAQINRRRTTGKEIADRMKTSVPSVEDAGGPSIYGWPAGAQAHIGNEVAEGDTYPMLIVRTFGSTPTSAVNGQVFLDGNDVFWATSVAVGEGPRTFSWPVRS